MADLFKYVQAQPFSLAGAGAITGDVTLTLKSFKTIDGVNLAMTDFGSVGFGTLEPGNGTLEEQISFTGVTQNANGTATLTGIKSVLFLDPYTESSGLAKTHAGSTSFIISNTAGYYSKFVAKGNDETITGIHTYTASPIVPTGGTGTQAANATDIANAVTGASGTATNSVFGTVKLSVAAASAPNPIAVGDNDTRVPTVAQTAALVGNNTDIDVGTGNKFMTQTGAIHNSEKYAGDTGTADAMVVALSPIPTALTTGMVVYVKAKYANATTTPTININGLGAKTIVSAVNTALTAGDIAANQFITLIYDGTNFVLQNGVSKGYVDTQNTATQNLLKTSLFGLVASANLKTSDDAAATLVGLSSYSKVKEILLNDSSGTIRVSMQLQLHCSGSTSAVYGKVYKNGVAVGAEHNVTVNGSTDTTFTDDITVATGDLIQAYGYMTNNGSITLACISNFRLEYDKTVINAVTNTVNL